MDDSDIQNDMCAYLSFNNITGDEFIIDSGCSHHMLACYVGTEAGGSGCNYRRSREKFVRTANGEKLVVAGSFDMGGMTGILHVPDITRNLISYSRWFQNNLFRKQSPS